MTQPIQPEPMPTCELTWLDIPPNTWRVITASHPQICHYCGVQMKGQKATNVRGGSWEHYPCVLIIREQWLQIIEAKSDNVTSLHPREVTYSDDGVQSDVTSFGKRNPNVDLVYRYEPHRSRNEGKWLFGRLNDDH